MQFIPGVILFVIVVGILANGISIVPQAQALIIERLGRYHATWDAGVHLMIPRQPEGTGRGLPAAARDHEGQCHDAH